MKLGLLRLAPRALSAWRAGRRAGIPGLEFDAFGRRMGLELLRRRAAIGAMYVLHPVDIVRYFEFDFALRSLPAALGRCLDVGSPRLFSLFLARTRSASIEMINPDRGDAEATRLLAGRLGLGTVTVRDIAAGELEASARYACIWSLSVVEHAAGEGADRELVASLYERLDPGGTLVLTVPVARAHRVEHRDTDVYGIGSPAEDGRVFFQRVYDERTLGRDLLEAAPWGSVQTSFFGELEPGWFREYERRWMKEGLALTVEDPRFVAERFRRFERWRDMPGDGVCGIALRR